jgi:hypothetical protein
MRYIFKERKYFLIAGESGAAPYINVCALSRPRAFLTLS